MIIASKATGGRQKGFTFGEVREWLTQAEAAGAQDHNRVTGMVTFGGKQYQLSVDTGSGERATDAHLD